MSALAGRVVLVTGASRGIGRRIAELVRDAGGHVIRLARSLADDSGEGWTDVRCDVTVAEEVVGVAKRILATVGLPDVVINNAGDFLLKPVEDTTPEEFRSQLEVNLVGPFLLLRALVPHLKDRGAGHVVTIGSVADARPYPGNVAYGASKYGVRGLHETLAAELAGTGIRFSLLSPGPTDTALWDPMHPEARNDLPNRDAMLRPQDVAEAVLFTITRPPHVGVEWMRLMPVR